MDKIWASIFEIGDCDSIKAPKYLAVSIRFSKNALNFYYYPKGSNWQSSLWLLGSFCASFASLNKVDLTGLLRWKGEKVEHVLQQTTPVLPNASSFEIWLLQQIYHPVAQFPCKCSIYLIQNMSWVLVKCNDNVPLNNSRSSSCSDNKTS